MKKNNLNKSPNISITIQGVILLLISFVVVLFLTEIGVVNRYYEGIIILMLINIVLATSLNFVTGFLGELALGHAGFMAIGAYSAAMLTLKMRSMNIIPSFKIDFLFFHLDLGGLGQLFISLVFAGIVAAVFGILIGIPVLRLQGDYLAIITLGFGEMIRTTIFNLDFLRGARGINGIPRLVGVGSIFWITVLIIFVLYKIMTSRHGRAILAIREDNIAAKAAGIPTVYYKIYTFAISAGVAGIGGGLLAHYLTIIDPKKFNFIQSVDILIFVVLGGMGSFTGAIIGAAILTVLPEFLRTIGLEEYKFLIQAILLIILMIFRPKGILGKKEFSLTGMKNLIKKKDFSNVKKSA